MLDTLFTPWPCFSDEEVEDVRRVVVSSDSGHAIRQLIAGTDVPGVAEKIELTNRDEDDSSMVLRTLLEASPSSNRTYSL